MHKSSRFPSKVAARPARIAEWVVNFGLLYAALTAGATPAAVPSTDPATQPAGVATGRLRCNGLVNPTIAPAERPTFSWIMVSEKPNARQSAYQISVDGGWDSGRVESDQSLHVPYGGPALPPGSHFDWRLRIWDADGQASDWNSSAFGTGLSAWTGQWIGLTEPVNNTDNLEGADWIWYPEGNPARSAPVGTRYFRRTVTLPAAATIASAVCLITVDNSFELRVNSQIAGAGDDFTKPNKIDIARFLHAGENQLEVLAINVGEHPSPAGLIAKLHLEIKDGVAIEQVTDAGWECSLDRKTWTPVMVMGAFGIDPWGYTGDDARPLPARYLRHELTVDKPIKRATAYVCGLGFFKLSVNGQPISDDVMDPALSDYHKADYYLAFDITGRMKPGANAIGVVLGNGRFYAPRRGMTAVFGLPRLLLQLELEYADGTKRVVASDQSWRVTDRGPIRANNEYDGETYDARMEMPGWDRPGFDDSTWQKADVMPGPGGIMSAQDVEPMRVTQIVRPVSVTASAPGTCIVDMGQNFYGTIRLKARAPRGTVVRMTSAYSLTSDGRLKTADNRGAICTDVYTFKGEGTEIWSPQFKGQGYRRVMVTGLPGTPTADIFQGLVIHTDAEVVGDFSCSNDLVNRIHSATRWGARMFLRSAPLDPDRDERQAWMGDPAKGAEAEAYNFDVSNFYRKWMNDLQQSQRPDGSLPDVAMYWNWGDGVEWPSVFTIIPDWMADFYGDPSVAQSHYEAIKTWVLAMRRHQLPDGTLKATSYGDWCDTYTIGGKITDFGHTSRPLISTAYQYHNCRIVQRWAKILGRADDEHTFGDMADKLKEAFNKKFYDPANHVYASDTQCAYTLALAFDLAPAGDRDALAAKLVDDILVRHQGHLTVGLVGNQWLLQTLTDIGRPDVAWTVVTQTTRPSWGYMISRGATTIWERWDYDTRDPGMNSEALLIQAGDLDAWFYQTLAGIRPAGPAFTKILIRPTVLGDLTWVKSHFDCPYGRIESNWQRTGDRFTLDVTIPPNTTATVIVPGKDGGPHQVGAGHYQFTSGGPF